VALVTLIPFSGGLSLSSEPVGSSMSLLKEEIVKKSCALLILLILVATLAVGCGNDEDGASGGDSDTDTDTDSDTDEPEDESSLIYDPNTVIEIVIEMDSDDWELLRNEQRDLSCLDDGVGNCLNGPCYSTYTWMSADVTVNGEVVENVGIRKKGMYGSVNGEKPGLKLKFNKFVENQLPFGMERMTLNNNISDPAVIRQCL